MRTPTTTAAPPATPPQTAPPQTNDAEFLGLPEPSNGFRIASLGRVIAPGADEEYCEVAELPGSPELPYHVAGFELANAEGSHHLIVSVAEPGTVSDRRLRELPLGTQVPCIGANQEFGVEGVTVLASTQTRHIKTELPTGVAQRVYGGQRIVFDYHFFNPGSEALMAKSALALHLRDMNEPVTLTSTLAFTNMTIDTPAGTEKTFTASCSVKQDLMLSAIARHTHRKGTDFSVWFDGGPRDGELIWTSRDWENDTELHFPEPLLMHAGEGFRFACGFRNEGTRPLRFGISASDEMCILAGVTWSPTPQGELAAEQCVVTWVDAQNIGRDTDEAGGFPKADVADALACHAGTLGLAILDSCLGCVCDSCSTIMARCNADSDCKALLDCSSACIGKPDCTEQCESAMFEHSSAVGLVTQVGECMRYNCGQPCAIAAPTP